MKKALIPNYYKNFKCIGGDCEDSCCAGWQITIDEGTLKKYKKVKHPTMKKRLDKELVAKKNGSPSEAAKIKLKNNRCAFLSADGWCEIYGTLGEHYLSHTCTLYPRTINQVGEQLEYSLTPSCPEATRHILLHSEGITFETCEVDEMPLQVSASLHLHTPPQVWCDYLPLVRAQVIRLLQQREMSLEARIEKIGGLLEAVQEVYVQGRLERIGTLCRAEDKWPKVSCKRSTREYLEYLLLVKQVFAEKKCRISRYVACLDEVLQGLGLIDTIQFQDAKRRFEEAEGTGYQTFLNKKGFMLENYFVNYIYERCMPMDAESPHDSFKRMQLYYDLLKCHLIGIAAYRGILTEESVVYAIQVFTKAYDHGEGYIEKISDLT